MITMRLSSIAAALACAGAAGAQSWQVRRTSWGDPDISGIYTNKDENGTPLERPDEFAGKTLADFGPAEMVALREERQRRAREQAPRIRGAAGQATGAGPPQRYEHPEPADSHAWLVTLREDGKV